MKLLAMKSSTTAVLAGLLYVGLSTNVWAAIQDYTFQLLVQNEIKQGDAVITVRLVDKRSGKPVPDAVIFAQRVDMSPDGMQEMATKVTPVPGSEPGLYSFKANLSMAGDWQLSLAAKVQGETDTLENKPVFKVVP